MLFSWFQRPVVSLQGRMCYSSMWGREAVDDSGGFDREAVMESCCGLLALREFVGWTVSSSFVRLTAAVTARWCASLHVDVIVR